MAAAAAALIFTMDEPLHLSLCICEPCDACVESSKRFVESLPGLESLSERLFRELDEAYDMGYSARELETSQLKKRTAQKYPQWLKFRHRHWQKI